MFLCVYFCLFICNVYQILFFLCLKDFVPPPITMPPTQDSVARAFLERWLLHAGAFLLLSSVVHVALHFVTVGATRIAADRPAPRGSVILREATLSVFSSCSIVTAIDMLLDGYLAQDSSGTADSEVLLHLCIIPCPHTLCSFFITASLLVLWGDAHFYWTHRMLHSVPFLYRHVHQVHHHSRYPNAFSGLCFHPVESLIYFSQLGIFVARPDLSAWRPLFKWGTILMPVATHHGFDDTRIGGHSTFHHAHHVRVVGNFGGLHAQWDRIFGTLLAG